MDEQEVSAEPVTPEDIPPEAVTPETATSWLSALPHTSLLALVREPEFASVSRTAFAGFRVNRSGSENPLVRRRLAHEITQNTIFAERIQALAGKEEPHPASPQNRGGVREEAAGSTPPLSKAGGGTERAGGGSSAPRDETLKVERDRFRKERDAVRDALHKAEERLTHTEAAERLASKAQAEQAKLVQKQTQRIERLERQVAKLHAERVQLVKTLRPGKDSSSRPIPPPSNKPTDAKTKDVWREAVTHLLHKNKHETVLGLALDVLRMDAEAQEALDLAAQAYVSRGLTHEAGDMVRRALALRLARAEMGPASDTLMRLLMLLPEPAEASREVHQWLTYLRTEEAIASARTSVERLRGPAPSVYSWLTDQVRSVRPALVDRLMPPPGALSPDDPLPLPPPHFERWSARQLITAVNANQETLVREAREGLTQLDADTATRVWTALTRAAQGSDDSVLAPLRRAPRGPAVVDGSNAAWFDQSAYAVPRARLRPILALRRTLRQRGYFPVLLYADAPLPHTVDDAQSLRAMLDRQEILLVDSGVDADEVLLREAKRCQAPLITNDYMADWDPHNEVEKIRFTISLTGEAHLLPNHPRQ
jgi:hypothetical protein